MCDSIEEYDVPIYVSDGHGFNDEPSVCRVTPFKMRLLSLRAL